MTRKKKPAIEKRILERLLHRLESEGLQAAVTYGQAALAQFPQVASIVGQTPQPLRMMLEAVIEQRRAKKAQAQQAQVAHACCLAATEAAAKAADRAALQAGYDSAVHLGAGTEFLAALTPEQRNLIGTVAERRAAVELRKASVRSTETRSLLECTASELDRWAADGRLPVLFRRRMQASFGSCEVRHWRRADVVAAKAQVTSWREEDAVARRHRRATGGAR